MRERILNGCVLCLKRPLQGTSSSSSHSIQMQDEKGSFQSHLKPLGPCSYLTLSFVSSHLYFYLVQKRLDCRWLASTLEV